MPLGDGIDQTCSHDHDRSGPSALVTSFAHGATSTMTDENPTGGASKLPLVIMGAVVAMAALLTIVLVAVRGPTTFDEGTPEATLQSFLNAALDDDEPAMLALLTEGSRQRCEEELERWTYGRSWYNDNVRAGLDEIEIDGEAAEATVVLRRSDSNDPFDSSTWSSDESFKLERSEGDWLIARASWPHPFASCTRTDL